MTCSSPCIKPVMGRIKLQLCSPLALLQWEYHNPLKEIKKRTTTKKIHHKTDSWVGNKQSRSMAIAYVYLKYPTATGSELHEQVSVRPSGNTLSCISSEEQSSQKRDNKHLYETASTKTLIAVKFERKQQESQGQARADVKVESSWKVFCYWAK